MAISRNLLLFLACWMCAIDTEVVLGFAAKKRGGKKKSAASTNKGFGAPPPTLDEILAKFPNNLPKEESEANAMPCPCGGETYGDCCAPFHRGEKQCLSMSDVLKTRYSAFSLRNIRYVMDTTHQVCRDWREDRIEWAKDLNKSGMFDSFEFTKLDAGPEEPGQDENEGYMDFKVLLTAKDDMDNAGQQTVVSERSRFLRDPDDKTWKYASGDVRSEVAGLEDTQLNA